MNNRVNSSDELYTLMESASSPVLCLYGDEKYLTYFESLFEKSGLAPQLQLATVNVTEDLAVEFQVNKLPQFRLFFQGNEILTLTGSYKFPEVVKKCQKSISIRKLVTK